MANDILTPLMITREAARLLHQKSNFLGAVNRQYDSRFSESGAKIGDLLNIRMPAKYTVRSGAPLSTQDHVERSTPIQISYQDGVDIEFTSKELTLDLDTFSERVLEPAMAQLAAHIESKALTTAMQRVANYVGTTSSQMTYKQFQQGGQVLTENLAPRGDRTTILNPASTVEFMDAVKGLFQSSENIKRQYREGIIGRTGGFDVSENTLLPSHTRGSLAGAPVTTGDSLGNGVTTNSWSSQTNLSVTGATSATTLKAGDIITMSGVYEVHPESKIKTGKLKKFVVQQDVTLTSSATTYEVTVKPAMIYGAGNAYQNCALSGVSDTSGLTISAFGVASTAYGQNLQFHKDAFVFATADLIDVSKFGAWGARDTVDGISVRIARQYDINHDKVPCRLDVAWGFAELYPELAVRSFHALG